MDFIIHTEHRAPFLASKASLRYGNPSDQIYEMLATYYVQGMIVLDNERIRTPRLGETLDVLWEVSKQTGDRYVWCSQRDKNQGFDAPGEFFIERPSFFLLPRATLAMAAPVIRGLLLGQNGGYVLIQSANQLITMPDFGAHPPSPNEA